MPLIRMNFLQFLPERVSILEISLQNKETFVFDILLSQNNENL